MVGEGKISKEGESCNWRLKKGEERERVFCMGGACLGRVAPFIEWVWVLALVTKYCLTLIRIPSSILLVH